MVKLSLSPLSKYISQLFTQILFSSCASFSLSKNGQNSSLWKWLLFHICFKHSLSHLFWIKLIWITTKMFFFDLEEMIWWFLSWGMTNGMWGQWYSIKGYSFARVTQFTVSNMKEPMTDPQTSAGGRVYYKCNLLLSFLKTWISDSVHRWLLPRWSFFPLCF